MSEYTVHLCPPDYPAKLFPGRCRHEPQFVMTASVKIVRSKRRNQIETAHAVCFACGLTRPATYGGNVLVDLHQLWLELGWHAQIGGRIIVLRQKWARVASHLFGDEGWNGRHERIARLIDPNLTMRLVTTRIDGDGTRLASVFYEETYLREAA